MARKKFYIYVFSALVSFTHLQKESLSHIKSRKKECCECKCLITKVFELRGNNADDADKLIAAIKAGVVTVQNVNF